MYNNTSTSYEKYYVSSSITKEETFPVDEPQMELSLEENIFNYGYLYSIELKRTKIKKELIKYFDFETHFQELDFLSANNKIFLVLPSIGKFIKESFDRNSILVLELLSENENWNTLFINIHTKIDWDTSNKFLDYILDSLYELFPEIATTLNVNIISHEF
ncbi:MAG: hypothetical protein Q8S54_07705 [Bacteroidota bacterium]|nr:hypothetical protein [Bacteroidota bacterium]